MKKLWVQKLITCLVLLQLISCGSGNSSINPVQPPPNPEAPQPETYHCYFDSRCPEIVISGDDISTDAFRGFADPSLEFDSSTNTLWMSYSWLNVIVSNSASPVIYDLVVRTHLAKSTDNGNSFSFVREINIPSPENHPDSGIEGLSVHEVSSLVKQSDVQWQLTWLKYFTPLGTEPGIEDRSDFLLWRTTATTPENLGDNNEVWASTFSTSDSWNAPVDLNSISELSDCAVLTEPALFNHNNQTYLSASCLVIDQTGRNTDRERLVLLSQTSNGFNFVGDILTANDASSFNADVFEQGDISISKDGTVLLIVTPILLEESPAHQGCIVFEFEDFSTAQLKRNASRIPLANNIITADSNMEKGLCTYDAASDTGIIMVLTEISQGGTEVEFSMRATGVHP